MRRVRAGAGEHADRGTIGLELVLLTPVLLLLTLFVVALGRIAEAGGRVEGAARDAARAASLYRGSSAVGGTTAARTAVAGALADAKGTCLSPEVRADPVYDAGRISAWRATVSCTASLSAVAVPGMPGSKQLKATSLSPVERFRGE